MSRSSRYTSICGFAAADFEKNDKRRWHRTHQLVRQDVDPLPLHAVSDPWLMAKDGKQWFDQRRHPGLIRK